VLDGDKDLTLKAMEAIGMEKVFHRVRIGPGKGACMGRVGKTVVFNLPGGPPSNHVALMLLALPGVRRLMGVQDPFPEKRAVQVMEHMPGQAGWTQLVYARSEHENGCIRAYPLRHLGRLQAMAGADLLLEIPEDTSILHADSMAAAWFFRQG
jgi:molybdopterin molybdotransferase